jgi:hypothetical protein
LIKLASGFEAFTQVRANNLPTFNETVPFDHIEGTKLKKPRHPVRGGQAQQEQAAAKPKYPRGSGQRPFAF